MIGVQKSYQAIADSDLRLLVVDASADWTDEDSRLLEKVRPLGALVVACNKSDLPKRIVADDLKARLSLDSAASGCTAVTWTSALTGEGIPELRRTILEVAAPARDLGGESEFITNLRHQQHIKESLRALAKARKAAQDRVPHEMLLIDLYEALRPLDAITGATYVNDLLDIIFSTFCVGK
jgi:tRNA modification GTPase